MKEKEENKFTKENKTWKIYILITKNSLKTPQCLTWKLSENDGGWKNYVCYVRKKRY